jgi:hypothetical protein
MAAHTGYRVIAEIEVGTSAGREEEATLLSWKVPPATALRFHRY